MNHEPPLDLPAPEGKEAEWALMKLARSMDMPLVHDSWEDLADKLKAKHEKAIEGLNRFSFLLNWALENHESIYDEDKKFFLQLMTEFKVSPYCLKEG